MSTLGYQIWLGGDLRTGSTGAREQGETLSDTVHRFGLEACQAQIAAVFQGRREPGPEPAEGAGPELPTGPDQSVPTAVGA